MRCTILIVLLATGCKPSIDSTPIEPVTPVVPQSKVVAVYLVIMKGCVPCKRFEPTFNTWARVHGSNTVKFRVVDIGSNLPTPVHSTPTVIITINGQVVKQWDGNHLPTESELLCVIRS